eukprot:m.231835 g.231835  ORF g.231835 m.231835 type:complete len:195 (+) comp12267_c0_seq1:24-608(+)
MANLPSPFPGLTLSMPFEAIAGSPAPFAFLESMLRQEPSLRAQGAAVWKSPDMTVCVHPNEMGSLITPSLFQAALAERNPFAESFRSSLAAGPAVQQAPMPQEQDQAQDDGDDHDSGAGVDQKRERRRERNRLAAQTCRQRKIDRENELRDRLNSLVQQRDAIARSVSRMEEKKGELVRILNEHRAAGCLFKST